MSSHPNLHPQSMAAVLLIKADFRSLGGSLLYLVRCNPMECPLDLAQELLFILASPPHEDVWCSSRSRRSPSPTCCSASSTRAGSSPATR